MTCYHAPEPSDPREMTHQCSGYVATGPDMAAAIGEAAAAAAEDLDLAALRAKGVEV